MLQKTVSKFNEQFWILGITAQANIEDILIFYMQNK